ncbi:uncharacterized protein SPPG_09577 [Spizellomyces punctatus DAOM BR117]|uniref:DUF4549 domain-containing protein n=1 Tax=Spizellomyces punctatus (strain DAOM BR117) TaxID=645134 RepID=A0A0L0H4I5_SPIPD|nr:uncharacterized protein SPPG_09577 [Spizellomyces punctatus DAOM BR117]KNC95831.1 hypothetical protein SPPG_09577 [Spizellomyces punctatus DAOM BR117]|eukprot:XP_016603871.1 hypothetical protein SPPG_09577 [Spizellomyces punctatus DAOM BR117]
MAAASASAAEKLSVAAGVAALAAQAELDPLANEKVEAEIPDELKEQPPESLFALDKRMEDLLNDIRGLHEGRHKDYQNISGRRDRLGAYQGMSVFEKFKQIRAERLENILRIEMPVKVKYAWEAIAQELDSYWNVDAELTSDKLFLLLMTFYKEKATQLVEENALLLSRWSRFCRTSYDIATFFTTFQRYQEWLQAEYTDAVSRYERLADAHEGQQRRAREEEARAEAERIERERRGILQNTRPKTTAVGKTAASQGRQSTKMAGGEQQGGEAAGSTKSATEAPSPPFGPNELGTDPLFDISDFVVFLRWSISTIAARKHVEMFIQRAKMLVHSDRVQLIKDYRLVNEAKPSQGVLETLNILEGINNYIENPPVKTPRIEDFLTEFDLLVAYWNLETPISREDGRPFAYEVDSKFSEAFRRQTAEISFPPYDVIGIISDGETAPSEQRVGSAAPAGLPSAQQGSASVHDSKASLAALAGLNLHPGFKNPNAPRLRYADWIRDVAFYPEFEGWQESQFDFLRQRRDVDFELRYEHDLIASNDLESVVSRLREAARRVFETSSTSQSSPGVTLSRPSSAHEPQQQSDQLQENHAGDGMTMPALASGGTIAGGKPFELGMKVPDPRDMELPKDFRVLDGKKHAFGLILRSNVEMRKVEQEITGTDSKRTDGDPTISTLFSEHEIFSFLQLRHIRLRDLRTSLLSQLNFFRSIEKRINLDWKKTKARVKVEVTDSAKGEKERPNVLATAALITHMWHQQELFDMPDASSERPNSAASGSGRGPNEKDGSGTEDIRGLVDGVVIIRDHRGIPFVYDVAVDDLKTLETTLLKAATLYINYGPVDEGRQSTPEPTDSGIESDRKYEDEMRFKMSERKADFLEGSYTFRSPNLDRAQLLLELYDHEVKFQFAKMELVNAYMEVYEHTRDPCRIQRIAQIITDLMHIRPNFDFSSPYFSRFYAVATKMLQIHAQTVLPMIKDGVERYREWVKRYFARVDPTAARESDASDSADDVAIPETMGFGIKRPIESPVVAGLPLLDENEKQTVTMHHAGVIVNMTEMIPTMDIIIDVYDAAKTACNEMGRVIEGLLVQGKTMGLDKSNGRITQSFNRQVVECTVWKSLYHTWQCLSDHSFKIPQLRGKRLIGQLDAETWLENPLLPDILLTDHYTPYETNERDKGLSIYAAALTPFTDTGFKNKGLEICQRFVKLLVMRERLYFAWLGTEYLRKIYELQFPQMGVNKAAFTGRLNSLRFDSPDMADNTAVEDDYEEEYADKHDNGHSMPTGSSQDSEDDRGDATWQSSMSLLRFGPLAIVELDDTIGTATTTTTAKGAFDLASLPGIQTAMKPDGIKQLRTSLKVQLVEKNWHMGAVEMHDMLLGELHAKLLFEGEAVKVEKAKTPASGRRSPQRYNNADAAQQGFDVDYRLLVTTVVPKKKALRKILLSEYGRLYKIHTRPDFSDEEREAAMVDTKHSLIEWYFSNMVEIALEECERAEYAKSINEFRNTVLSTTYGKLLFRTSKVKRHFDFFANQEKGTAEAEIDPAKLSMETVQIQDVVHTDLTGTEKICKLWHLPYLTEIIMIPNQSEKAIKGTIELSQKVYRNAQIFRRALSIQSTIFDLFLFVGVFAHLLQDNRRYAAQVRQVREADYVVNAINAFKKDLSYQGPQAEFTRIETYLLSKWQLWILKLRLALASSMYTIGMNLRPEAHGVLLSHHDRILNLVNLVEQPSFKVLAAISRVDISLRRTPYPSPYIFITLDDKTKRVCDKKVLDLEECLDEFFQATLLNFGENAEEVNKMQSDFLLTGLKLLALRRTYLRVLLPDGIKTEEQLGEFFRTYKMRILVPAVRLYHRIGAKGNASIPLLLRDEMVTATVDFDFNRIAQASFDKCQTTILQTELLREYTFQLLRQARSYHDRLADERTGRLFKVYESIDVPAPTGEKGFAFRMSEEDYTAKTGMVNEFVRDLWKANATFMREVQELQKGSKSKGAQATGATALAQAALDDSRVFACTKELLSQTITRLALQLTKWQEKRRGEQDHFMGTLMGRMLEMIKNGEKVIRFMAQEKKELLENYKRDVRLLAFHLCSELHADFATTSVELTELRKHRRIDERKIRNRILDEYDDLVQELVMEINVLRNRFSEYRVNTFQEVMNIMGEAKKEELQVVVDNREMPQNMKDSARWMIKHEEEAQDLRQENHELKMTLLKVRSMYVIKEQSLRSMYEKKTRKLTEENKAAEEKLWDSYREAEARERILRKQLTKAQKMLSMRESENETLQRQLREEQQRVRQLTPIKDRAASAGGRRYGDSESARINELQERLQRYESLSIDAILQELSEKTRLLEQMIEERRKNGGMAGGMVGKQHQSAEHRRRAVSARLARPVMVIKAVASRRKGLGPYSDYKDSPTVEEETLSAPGDKMEKDINDHLVQKINWLAMQNKALRHTLAECGIQIPDDATTVEESETKQVRKSVMWEDETVFKEGIDDTDAAERKRARMRASQSAPPGGRRRETVEHRASGKGNIYGVDLGSRPSSAESTVSPRPPQIPTGFGEPGRRSSTSTPPPPPSSWVGSDHELNGGRASSPALYLGTDVDRERERDRPSLSARGYRPVSRFVEAQSASSPRQSTSLANRLTSPAGSGMDVMVPSVLRAITPPPLTLARSSTSRPSSSFIPSTAPHASRSLHSSQSESRLSLSLSPSTTPRSSTPR